VTDEFRRHRPSNYEIDGTTVTRKGEVEMRKILAGLWISLDGVTESPEKWVFPYFNDGVRQEIESQMAQSDTMLLGRRTYEEFAGYWPDKTAEDDPIADYMNDTPKLVASSTLKEVEWRNSTLITGDVVQELTKVKQQPGKNIWITGSATLVRSLLRDGILDELNLLLFPIVRGTVKRLFEDMRGQMALKLTHSRAFETGVVSLVYEPAVE
jgi:dihydrofolate reductase